MEARQAPALKPSLVYTSGPPQILPLTLRVKCCSPLIFKVSTHYLLPLLTLGNEELSHPGPSE
jgi:hypothetical protein